VPGPIGPALRARRYVPQGGPAVAYGHGALDQLPDLVAQAGGDRWLIFTGRSLARHGELVGRVADLLGPRFVGVFDGCREHTPDTTVQAGRAAVAAAGADGLLSVGGSSVVDTAKAVAMATVLGGDLSAYTATAVEGPDGARTMRRGVLHDQLHSVRRNGGPVDPLLPIVAVPTTLSGAEFTEHAGVTAAATGVKRQLYHPDALPVAVVLDPWATVATPATLWTSTAVKVLDHAVEIVASPWSSPVSQANCLAAFRRVVADLAPSVDPDNLDARGSLLTAAWLALAGYPNQMAGLNHGIGHQLGGLFGVPHGIAAGCTLPHTMRFNRSAAPVAFDAMARELAAAGGSNSPGGASPDAAADAVAALVADLGLPTRLRDVGVPEEHLPRVADLVVAVEAGIVGNPRPVTDAADVLEGVLRPAW